MMTNNWRNICNQKKCNVYWVYRHGTAMSVSTNTIERECEDYNSTFIKQMFVFAHIKRFNHIHHSHRWLISAHSYLSPGIMSHFTLLCIFIFSIWTRCTYDVMHPIVGESKRKVSVSYFAVTRKLNCFTTICIYVHKTCLQWSSFRIPYYRFSMGTFKERPIHSKWRKW